MLLLISFQDIDGSYKINKGLRVARQLLCDLTDLGVPVGSELLDTISPQYIADRTSCLIVFRISLSDTAPCSFTRSYLLGSDWSPNNGITTPPRARFWCFLPHRVQERH
jgi:hypothetical protein